MRTVTVKVEGMTCGHCQMAVTKALKSVTGVTEAVVSLEQHEATVTFDPTQADFEKLARAVDEAGYRLVPQP